MKLMKSVMLGLVLSLVAAHAGMKKLEAISMIETGDNDRVIGGAGEVSRYQIKPVVWELYSDSRSYQNQRLSARVAEQHLATLESAFQRRTGRAPTDFDSYVLWNGGLAYYAQRGFSPARVTPKVRDRAQRYVNLRTMGQSK